MINFLLSCDSSFEWINIEPYYAVDQSLSCFRRNAETKGRTERTVSSWSFWGNVKHFDNNITERTGREDQSSQPGKWQNLQLSPSSQNWRQFIAKNCLHSATAMLTEVLKRAKAMTGSWGTLVWKKEEELFKKLIANTYYENLCMSFFPTKMDLCVILFFVNFLKYPCSFLCHIFLD